MSENSNDYSQNYSQEYILLVSGGDKASEIFLQPSIF